MEAGEFLRQAGASINHRGPDDSGVMLFPQCGLGFQRLAIIDCAGGHQPMVSASGRTAVVFNGEIYNYQELRSELTAAGYPFRTKSDTEVLLAGWEHWNDRLFQKLRGIFAFVLYDLTSREVIAARDHTGIKPLYYTERDGVVLFASEIKALLCWPGMRARLNEAALPKYLSFLWVPAPETLFEGISILEPAHYLTISRDRRSLRKFWNPDLWEVDDTTTEAEWVERLDSEFQRVVREQMISEVPLGAFLSGGVDSSTIIAYMNRISEQQIITYTTGFDRKDLERDVIGSDLEYARIAAKKLRVESHEIILRPDVVNLLPKLVWHMDEPPADPAAVTTYLICQAAKEKCTVMLSGVGGDEIFGGYPRYLANLFAEQYQKFPAVIRNGLVEPITRQLPTGSITFIRNLKKFMKSAKLPFFERYFGYLTYYSHLELQQLLRAEYDWSSVFEIHRSFFQTDHADRPLQSMMNLDLKTFLPNLNLMYTDKMSSASAVEVRVPFLDHLLVEMAARIPDRMKIRRTTRKYVLKKLAQQVLPKEVVWRKKAGFGAPIGAWLKGQARGMMQDLLSEETVRKRGLFHYQAVDKLIHDHLEGKEYNANQIWQLMTLELWFQMFLDRHCKEGRSQFSM